MAASKDPWVHQYNEAAKLAEDITNMISESSSFPATGLETQRYSASIRRKITILGTRLDTLEFPSKQPLTEREMNRRKDMLENLRSKVSQMASTMNISSFANRDSLLEPESKPVDAMSRTGLDDSGFVDLQRQIMRG
ncbi:syntaxin-51-like isoform X1 [Olea europaea subsp. europaea]|uniref:Syntaxin-51-like isoform X1 n=1 Tax=Olea europaea subsp. europaea TaxID=158383 RepID=A0A8S0UXC2_OLEEU|nr:syntaxin-51-like isoform X1 [Olea europaea subsp. europaea]